MLLKLIKFNLRSSKKTFLLISGGVLLFALILSVCINIVAFIDTNGSESSFFGLSAMVMIPLISLSALGLSFTFFAAFVVSAYSIYSVYGQSSAYLYFTLPTSRKKLYTASVMTFIIKVLFIALLGIISYFIFSLTVLFNPAAKNLISFSLSGLGDTLIGSDGSESFLEIALASVSSLLSSGMAVLLSAVFINFACIYGCAYAQKRKLFGCIVFGGLSFLIYSFVKSILIDFLLYASLYDASETLGYLTITAIINLAKALFSLAVTIALHFASVKKLENDFDVI